MFSCTAEVRSVNFVQEQHSIYADTEKKNFTINHLLPRTVSSSFFLSLLHKNHLKIRHCVLSLCCCQGPKGQRCVGSRGQQRRWPPGLAVGTCLCWPSRPARPPLGCQVSLHAAASGAHHWIQSLRSGVCVVVLLSTLSLLLRPLWHVFVLSVAVFICRAFSVCDWCESLHSGKHFSGWQCLMWWHLGLSEVLRTSVVDKQYVQQCT